MRHYFQILLRDFDLSPNFQIIKFNITEEGPFDYKQLNSKSAQRQVSNRQRLPLLLRQTRFLMAHVQTLAA